MPSVGPALGEPSRAGVVVRETVDVVVERVEPGGRHDPRLAHRAAEPVLLDPRACHQLALPAMTAPSGQPRPFERQSVTVSAWLPIRAAEMPVATDALASRAPSR